MVAECGRSTLLLYAEETNKQYSQCQDLYFLLFAEETNKQYGQWRDPVDQLRHKVRLRNKQMALDSGIAPLVSRNELPFTKIK